MGNKIYIGNLPFNVDNTSLKKLFEPFGNVTEATVIMNKFSGRSKGFGFVTFADEECAEKAVSSMNGKEFEGREIKVSIAKPMRED